MSVLKDPGFMLCSESEPLSELAFTGKFDSMDAAMFMQRHGCYSKFSRKCGAESEPKLVSVKGEPRLK